MGAEYEPELSPAGVGTYYVQTNVFGESPCCQQEEESPHETPQTSAEEACTRYVRLWTEVSGEDTEYGQQEEMDDESLHQSPLISPEEAVSR